jgi:hypothetical protein
MVENIEDNDQPAQRGESCGKKRSFYTENRSSQDVKEYK